MTIPKTESAADQQQTHSAVRSTPTLQSHALTFRCGLPPTTNNAYINLKRGGRALSKDAKEFKEKATKAAAVASQQQRWCYRLGMRLQLVLEVKFSNKNRRRDLSNRVKLLEDSLAAALGFDDSVIDCLVVRRGSDSASEPGLVVELREWRAA